VFAVVEHFNEDTVSSRKQTPIQEPIDAIHVFTTLLHISYLHGLVPHVNWMISFLIVDN
jgi:hypothetical protein